VDKYSFKTTSRFGVIVKIIGGWRAIQAPPNFARLT